MVAMWPSASSAPPDFVLIGSPQDRRVELFQAALVQLGLPPARMISYRDLIAGRTALADSIQPTSIVRIESPGKDFEVERALLALGAEIEEPDGQPYERLSRRAVEELSFEKGRILPSRQWYLGYCQLLQHIKQQVEQHQVMNTADDIMLMFDKRATHALLAAQAISVPPATGLVNSYEELIDQMQRYGWSRVFLKPAHGSSASGVVAYRFAGNRHQAITTVEMVCTGNERRLYNSRDIRVYQQHEEIVALIDALCRHRVHVERWLPKAGYAQRTFDLRIVMIARQVQHVVARLSRSPMTNLHLLNKRGDIAEILAAIGEARWEQACRTCEQVARLFESLYMGIDLLFTSAFKQHAIVEVNAFGDLLPGVLYHNQDTYTAEIVAALKAGAE
ncbi:MAG TPA: STM4014 family protein [Ktedonobacteraceae bacterium]|nr:STM4014 family protein [Ktedonobacteraceae bacterium]